MTDRLSLANALADAKIDRPAAERIATEIFEAIHDSVASKADLQRFEAATSAYLQRLEAAIQRLEAAFKAGFAAVRSEMALIEHRLLTRLGSLIVIDAGLLFAAMRCLPPVH